jgi:hypothetical protein
VLAPADINTKKGKIKEIVFLLTGVWPDRIKFNFPAAMMHLLLTPVALPGGVDLR